MPGAEILKQQSVYGAQNQPCQSWRLAGHPKKEKSLENDEKEQEEEPEEEKEEESQEEEEEEPEEELLLCPKEPESRKEPEGQVEELEGEMKKLEPSLQLSTFFKINQIKKIF